MIILENVLNQIVTEAINEIKDGCVLVNGEEIPLKQYKKIMKAKQAQANPQQPKKKPRKKKIPTELESCKMLAKKVFRDCIYLSSFFSFSKNANIWFGAKQMNQFLSLNNNAIDKAFGSFNTKFREYKKAYTDVLNATNKSVLYDAMETMSYRLEDTAIECEKLYKLLSDSEIAYIFRNASFYSQSQAHVKTVQDLCRLALLNRKKIHPCVNKLRQACGLELTSVNVSNPMHQKPIDPEVLVQRFKQQQAQENGATQDKKTLFNI